MSHNLRSLTAEFVGTLLFVFLGAGSVVTTAPAGPNAGAVTSLIVALAHGVGMAVIVSATMNISGGHINPAVTTGLWIANKIDGRLASQYILAQNVLRGQPTIDLVGDPQYRGDRGVDVAAGDVHRRRDDYSHPDAVRE